MGTQNGVQPCSLETLPGAVQGHPGPPAAPCWSQQRKTANVRTEETGHAPVGVGFGVTDDAR
jgi:hypothetical protein